MMQEKVTANVMKSVVNCSAMKCPRAGFYCLVIVAFLEIYDTQQVAPLLKAVLLKTCLTQRLQYLTSVRPSCVSLLAVWCLENVGTSELRINLAPKTSAGRPLPITLPSSV